MAMKWEFYTTQSFINGASPSDVVFYLGNPYFGGGYLSAGDVVSVFEAKSRGRYHFKDMSGFNYEPFF